MADKALTLRGEGLTPELITSLDEQFSQDIRALIAARDTFFTHADTFRDTLHEAIDGRMLRVLNLGARAFTYYGGRMVTNDWMGNVQDMGPKQYYYVEPDKLIGKTVLGLRVSYPYGYSGDEQNPHHMTLRSLRSDGALDPELSFAFEGIEYSGLLRGSIELEIVGQADETFVATHTPRALAEIHEW